MFKVAQPLPMFRTFKNIKKDWAQKKLLPVRTSYQKELMSASVLMPYMTNFGKPT